MTKDNSIRVLYKKPKQTPEVKFVNLFKLKNFIEQKNLITIPYEKLFIICNKNQSTSSNNFNIVLPFGNISGDLILVAKDDNTKEFKGLSVEDVNWYTTDLINKSFNNLEKSNNNNKTTQTNSNPKFNNSTNNTSTKPAEQPIQNNNLENLTAFEKNLLGVLASISLTLSNLLKEKMENE